MLTVFCGLVAAGESRQPCDANDGWRQLTGKDFSRVADKRAARCHVDANGVIEPARPDKGPDMLAYIWAQERYGNFRLELEFMVTPGSNSGVFIRTADINDPVPTGIEIQVFDSYDANKPNGRSSCGEIYDCLAPKKKMCKKPGEWNHAVIIARDNILQVILNGSEIINMDVNQWTEANKNPDGSKNKFNTAIRDMPRTGFIGLQYHKSRVFYRNIHIKVLK